MKRIKIDPRAYPKDNDESWWIVHPNTAGCEFRLPAGAVTVCIKDLLLDVFRQNVAYNVISTDNHNGWIVVEHNGDLYDMPQYLFARHFDAESFVVGTATSVELEKAKPFDYKSTVPFNSTRQLELFEFKG